MRTVGVRQRLYSERPPPSAAGKPGTTLAEDVRVAATTSAAEWARAAAYGFGERLAFYAVVLVCGGVAVVYAAGAIGRNWERIRAGAAARVDIAVARSQDVAKAVGETAVARSKAVGETAVARSKEAIRAVAETAVEVKEAAGVKVQDSLRDIGATVSDRVAGAVKSAPAAGARVASATSEAASRFQGAVRDLKGEIDQKILAKRAEKEK